MLSNLKYWFSSPPIFFLKKMSPSIILQTKSFLRKCGWTMILKKGPWNLKGSWNWDHPSSSNFCLSVPKMVARFLISNISLKQWDMIVLFFCAIYGKFLHGIAETFEVTLFLIHMLRSEAWPHSFDQFC